ncbi:hypothetical protein nbrc107696_05920 [Gordonia spumicola]|uniref:Uncharacterized protein n=1 Tax=Gordonia spumicola TaxID=589161 RepID=A0A7I9V407_9ACTN|nr:hypothetical protein [Gordonia spumicola]GEE00146.1 hypothetical protein nbrc107696_05920 [Gordonia spumicola]
MKKSLLRSAVAATAVSAMIGFSISPVHAAAAEPVPDPFPTSCVPGDAEVKSGEGWTADCTKASPSVVASVADSILAIVAPDLGIKLADMNRAIALNILGFLPGNASIAGDGFTMAVGAGGDAHANAPSALSGAIALGLMQGTANANASFGGLALATSLGADAVANAKALPGGVAIAVGSGKNVDAVALGGITTAVSGVVDDKDAAYAYCTALYGTASVTDDKGKNVDNCTSVMFIFQKSQKGDGPVVYAIKNPFSAQLAAPLALLAPFLELGASLGMDLPIPAEALGLIKTGFVPYFSEDLFRVVMTDQGPKFESDLFKPKAPAEEAPKADAAPVVAAKADADPALAAAVAEEDEAPAVTTTPSADVTPVVEAPATNAPATEVPATEAPVADEPAETTAAQAPAADASSDAALADDAPAADEPVVDAAA